MAAGDIICWEALDPDDASVRQAQRLYEQTQPPAERIPWAWIAGAVADRRTWRPGRWSAHLLVAAPRRPHGQVTIVGFAYGIHLPSYGGYAAYLGVAEGQRRGGVGTRLMRLLSRVLQMDACCAGEDLPFVLWESRRPEADAPAEAWSHWQARLRLFDRVGALWVAGVDFLAPNFARRGGPPVPLQLFLQPVDRPAEAFRSHELREVAAGLLRGVYRREPGDQLFDATLPPACRPVLRPAAEAGPGDR
jgi:hypothetical protein